MMKRVLLTIALTLFACVASAQIAFDAASGASDVDGNATMSVSHTFTGTNRAALINVVYFSNPAQTPSSLTVGGSATGVTLLYSDSDGVAADTRRNHAAYYVVAPASGAQTVTFTATGNMEHGAIQVVSLTGVHQTVPVGTHQAIDGSSATATSPTVTSAAGELVVDGVGSFFPATSVTVDAGQTSRIENEDWGGSGAAAGMSTEAGAASVVTTWTIGSSAPWSIVAVPFLPAGGGGSSSAVSKIIQQH